MNTPPNEALERPTRPMYWSVRRELWENRSIYIAPLIVAAFVLFGSFFSVIGLPRRMQNLPANDPEKAHAIIVKPFSFAPAPIIFVTLIVGIFYSLDALYGERRDRSILFWKSLPVSDRTAVLAKACIPIIVLPLVGFVLGQIVQLMLLMLSTVVLLAHRMNPAAAVGEFRWFQELLVMIYGLTVHALWFAPIYAWLLLVSAWAKRTPLLWAVLPPIIIGLFEKLVFNTTYFGLLLKYRVTGAMTEAFGIDPSKHNSGVIDRVGQLSPIRFLAAPGLWLGLLFAAGCLIAAIRLRRYREPI